MKNNEEKLQYILTHGWEVYGKHSFVKTEWLNESELLNREPHLCPNWYHVETLENAYKIAMKEKETEEFLLSHGWEKQDNGYVKSKWTNKKNPLTLSDAYEMEISD